MRFSPWLFLQAFKVLKLYSILIKSPDGTVQLEIRRNHRYYPWFSDCIGAIDGTHVLASIFIEQQNRFSGQKGTTPQTVLAAINFNLKFMYVLAGWEGYAHDFHILNDALERLHRHSVALIEQLTNGEKGEKQLWWSKSMEYLMLEIPADEVKQGNKSTNQFKLSSFNRISDAIKQQLGVDCSPKHVENHLKTL